MNLMSVDIPAKKKPNGSWGKIVLIETTRVIRGDIYLRVLVYLDYDASTWRFRFAEPILRKVLNKRFTWLSRYVAFGEWEAEKPIGNPKGALLKLATMLGRAFDDKVEFPLPVWWPEPMTNWRPE